MPAFGARALSLVSCWNVSKTIFSASAEALLNDIIELAIPESHPGYNSIDHALLSGLHARDLYKGTPFF